MATIDRIAQGNIRRYFRAKKKLNTPGLVSHITQRSAGRSPMFIEDDDYFCMIGLLKAVSEKYDLKIFAFCAMPNHIHLLLAPREPNLYDAMRDLFSRYVAKFNRKFERKGHLVGSPYRQAICFDDSYLLTASLYIHLNPVKAGLSDRVVDYRWSSSRLYCYDDAPESFVDPFFILGLLSSSIPAAKERYRLLLKNGGGLETERVLEQEDAINRFRSRLSETFPKLFSRLGEKNRTSEYSGLDLLSQESLENRIEDLRHGRLPGRPESHKARKFLVEQLIARGYKRSEIAAHLGVSRKTVYNWLNSNSP